MTILDALKGISAYPVPATTLNKISATRLINLSDDLTHEGVTSGNYRLAEADLMLWLSKAPNISQGGQSYTIGDNQREQLRSAANAVYQELEPSSVSGVTYGYKGNRI
jgi:hypothetical protein